MAKLIIALAFLLLLTACSTPPLSDKQVEAMNTPTITLNCTSGCSASYTDPRDRPSMPTNGWDTANHAISAVSGAATSVAPWAAIGITAAEGIKNAVGNDNSVRNNDESSRDNSVVTNNNDDNRVDNSTRDNRTFDSTHEPTIVTQPSPIIVRPEVVQQQAE